MSSIFLSHNHRDKAFVRKLAERLNSHGILTWVDEAEIRVGDSLITKIESGIKNFTYLGVVLSSNSVNSQWVRREVNIALTQEIYGTQVKVLPLLIEPCEIPPFLLDKLYADFTKDFDEGFETLLRRLSDDLHDNIYKSKRALELLQRFYQDWISFGKLDHLLLKNEYIDVILKYIPDHAFSLELLEYLLFSIAVSDVQFHEYIPKVNVLLAKVEERLPSLLIRLLGSSNPRISGAAIEILINTDDAKASQELIRLLNVDLIKKLDNNIIKAFIKWIEKDGLDLPRDLVKEILARNNDNPDWFTLSYCIHKLNIKSCLLIGDGTDFARELGAMAALSGFQLITMPVYSAFKLDSIDENILTVPTMIILVRGETFEQGHNHDFYQRLANYVKDGGILLATSFTGWETRGNKGFTKVLPFEASGRYYENEIINCRITAASPVKDGLSITDSVYATFEILTPAEGSDVWLETIDTHTPIFGNNHFGSGSCYYLNICQHWCSGTMMSPFQKNNLGVYFQGVFKWIFENIEENKSE